MRFQKTYGAISNDGYVGYTNRYPLDVGSIRTISIDLHSTDADGATIDTTAVGKVEGSLGNTKYYELSPSNISVLDSYGGGANYDVSAYSDLRIYLSNVETPTVVDVVGYASRDITGSTLSGAQGSDGYVAFFTGSNTIAGDNDIYFNRTTNQLELNSALKANGGIDLVGGNLYMNATDDNTYISNGGFSDKIYFYAGGLQLLKIHSTSVQVANGDLDMASAGKRLYSSSQALNLGTAASTSHSLVSGDVLVGSHLEVDGNIYLDGSIYQYGNSKHYMGGTTGADTLFYSVAGWNQFTLAVGSNVGRNFNLVDGADGSSNAGLSNSDQVQLNIFSNGLDKRLSLYHDDTDGYINVVGGNIVIDANASLIADNVKDLTESTDDIFAKIDIPSGGHAGGIINYHVHAADGSDLQVISGVASFAAVNNGGTIVTDINKATGIESSALTSGTLTVSLTAADAGSNVLDLKANAVSSLIQTTLHIHWSISLNHGSVVTPVS